MGKKLTDEQALKSLEKRREKEKERKRKSRAAKKQATPPESLRKPGRPIDPVADETVLILALAQKCGVDEDGARLGYKGVTKFVREATDAPIEPNTITQAARRVKKRRSKPKKPPEV